MPDQVFSQKMMGDGIAIRPSDGKIVSPLNGEVVHIFPAKHAMTLRSEEGVELLVHIGLDTIRLNGEGFDLKVSPGDKIKTGAPLADVQITRIAEKGYDVMTPIIVLNRDRFKVDRSNGPSTVTAGKDMLIRVIKK
ncbi:PTS sugar transporter subunit IIA [Thermoactinomyces mirandus]|uniref:PTS sugar transporter subunit IIA n=1 Tax=Thermoactinomyces mirandus TaxID=2756294 RepID=UPI0028AE1BA5|nr:PTS glucose transporter subunit IIA [Thermoactinomyces mirandus]